MANPICLSPLKFYGSTEMRNHRKSYAYGHIAPLVMPFNTLDPFQFVLPYDVNDITYAQLTSYGYDGKNGSEVIGTGFIDHLKEAGLKVVNVYNQEIGNKKICIFPGLYSLFKVRYEGLYDLRLEDNLGNWYYSELFCFSSNIDNLLTIEYWNPECDFAMHNGLITFTDGFKFKLRLNTELGKPEYSFEEEVTKRLGYQFIENQTSKKTYKFNAIVPEYVCDAMRIIKLCSKKTITSLGNAYEATSFDMDVDWQDQGDLASVTCSFDTDNVISVVGGYRYKNLGGDYNADYNNDYDNQ